MTAANRRAGYPKEARIRKRREYLETYRTGRKTFGRYVVVFGRLNGHQYPRLGITATRKLGKANVRNLRKRWTREIFRENRVETGLDALGLDLVVNIKPGAAAADFSSFREDLLQALRRAARDARRSAEEGR
ncbi:MAG: ribonuclease P protein component [Acidobacteria bacterium]|nr:ribonuclease P protein component [Acidobacteriota bacterium]